MSDEIESLSELMWRIPNVQQIKHQSFYKEDDLKKTLSKVFERIAETDENITIIIEEEFGRRLTREEVNKVEE